VSTWRTSSYSNGDGGDCVEVANGDEIHVRDTKNRYGMTLTFDTAAWAEFITRLRG
jgi:hypothetical protein